MLARGRCIRRTYARGGTRLKKNAYLKQRVKQLSARFENLQSPPVRVLNIVHIVLLFLDRSEFPDKMSEFLFIFDIIQHRNVISMTNL